MDEEIKRRRHEEWLRRKGSSAKNGEDAAGAETFSRGSAPTQSSTPPEPPVAIHSAAPAVERPRKRVREAAGAAELVTKRTKAEFELETFGQVLDDAFSVVSWNLDGLTELDLAARTMFFIDMMRVRKPAVVMLQEVTDFTMKFIKRFLSQPYHLIEPPTSSETTGERYPYYNCLLLSKYHWELKGCAECIFFKDSKMGRHLLLQHVVGKNLTDGSHDFIFGSTHIESLKDPDCVQRRVEQTMRVFAIMEAKLRENDDARALCIVIGGDFNARQAEMRRAKKSYDSIADVWEALGSAPKENWTWDMFVNDNLSKADGSSSMQVRTRFDRMFFRSNESSNCKPEEFKLIGRERIGIDSNMFVSDHWGMAASFRCAT